MTRIAAHYRQHDAVPDPPQISVCIVNTDGRDLLLACLRSIAANPPSRPHEILVLDNASRDGSAGAVREAFPQVELIELSTRRGKAENDSDLMSRARGDFCLLLNEDSELTPGAADALVAALESEPAAAVAGARLLNAEGTPQPCAWRFPGVRTALAGALLLHNRHTVQSRGNETRTVDWVQSAGMLVRKRAFDEVGPMDPAFFVYSDEVDWQKRANDAGWKTLFVPAARIYHREQLSHGASARRRIVEFSRNRDLYMKKHHGQPAALVVRVLSAWAYSLRAVGALVLPGKDASRYAMHARYSLFPGSGEGLREQRQEQQEAES
ncbi:MAG: glycosyltransferase family 2 protein [Solirubrobacterales bacterium]